MAIGLVCCLEKSRAKAQN